MNKNQLHQAWVLHYRPYKEASVIADLLCSEFGKVSVVASRVRGRRSNKNHTPMMQPFSQMQISWYGSSTLKTLKKAELEKTIRLQGDYLYCGLYANELLVKILPPFVAVDGLWELYCWLIDALYAKGPLQPLLRRFEKNLLTLLGYAIPLTMDVAGEMIQAERYYIYTPSYGFSASKSVDYTNPTVFSGKMLLAYAKNDLESAGLKKVKQLNRMALNSLLNGKTLHSRKLFLSKKKLLLND